MKKLSIVKIIILVAMTLITAMFVRGCIRGFREPVVFIDGDMLVIRSSDCGVTLHWREIYSVRLINELPTLTRGDGFGAFNTQRGRVRTSNLGEGLAYIRVNNPPYIYLELISDDNYVFLNLHDADDTRELYRSIRVWLQR